MTLGVRPLRVLMTVDAVGGVWAYATALSRALVGCGHSVHLVVLGPEPSEVQRQGLRGLPGFSLEASGLALEWADPAGDEVPRARAHLEGVARRVRPDIVHLNGFREAAYGWNAPVLVAAHSCARSWWHACRGSEPDEPRWCTYVENVRRGLAAADAWVAPSAAFHRTMADLYAPPSPGQVIHNGADAPLGPWHNKEPLVLGAGRLWDEAKNIGALAAAASPERWPIVIAGPTASEVDGSVLASTGEAGATFTGALARDELFALMARAEIFATPALYEPFGLAALEAAARGCALVLSEIASFRELWDGAAVFVDPRQPATVAAALDRLQRDPALRRELQGAARARARRYTVAAMADGYQQLYATLLNRREGNSVAQAAPALELAP